MEDMVRKKVHWLQTEEGKKKMSRLMKKRWRKKKKTATSSKAETLIKKKVGKQAMTMRVDQYVRVAKIAVAAEEVPALMQAVKDAVFFNMWGGK
jgi:hypothetical protein